MLTNQFVSGTNQNKWHRNILNGRQRQPATKLLSIVLPEAENPEGDSKKTLRR